MQEGFSAMPEGRSGRVGASGRERREKEARTVVGRRRERYTACIVKAGEGGVILNQNINF